VDSEDDADSKLWEQAAHVVGLLAQGKTQREVAGGWINLRTGEPYSHVHVNYVAQTSGKFTYQTPRPRFRDAYNEVANRKGAHVSKNTGDHEWYTPKPIIEAARLVMGGIDLDPASSQAANEVVQANKFFTREQNGLDRRWKGRVWMNPPYSQPWIDDFCLKLEAEIGAGNVSQAISLTNNGTETHWGQVLLRGCAAVCFHDGRVKFWAPGKESVPLQGQMITYFGPDVQAFCREFSTMGAVCLNGTGIAASTEPDTIGTSTG
jgi:ParB family chromosome partitioning protein